MTNTVSISDLVNDLSVRSGRAIISQLGLRSPALRTHLEHLYAQEPGSPGALLADPVFEAAFGWTQADGGMQTLAKSGLLRKDLISAMDRPPREFREYAFPRHRKPFQHQLDCWRLLLDDVPRSVLVTSGTGSGKTECFLVPILEALARERAESGGLSGVRALFLYPLNALINSQRGRLRAWCEGFGQDIRFCLYNGETPETVPAHEQRRAGPEQISRKLLREDPAPVLVTNSTMLEYMLVRTEDRAILERSHGKLRWIVLDEAHTYIGSQAAEMALLLRRVLHRFDVAPAEVRFIATSATIGGEDAAESLRRFLADISGAPEGRVHVVTGQRFVPPLSVPDGTRDPGDLSGLEPRDLYEVLCHDAPARALRSRLAQRPETLTSLRNDSELDGQTLTKLLEKASVARRDDEAFLPLRVHLFHRAQRGLWACINGSCPGRQASIDAGSGWDFGPLFPQRRTRCDHCEHPVFEVVICGECGQDYLSAEETYSADQNVSSLRPHIEDLDIDEFELEVELDEDVLPTLQPLGIRRLICGREIASNDGDEWRLDRETHILSKDGPGVSIRLSPIAAGALACPKCGAGSRRNLRELRVGAPFALSTIVPTALEHTPPMPKGTNLPSGGKRLLGFSDSRQGSARLGVRLQQEAERNRVRSILYHALATRRQIVDTTEIEKLEKQVVALREANNEVNNPALQSLLEQQEAKLAQARAASGLGELSWAEAATELEHDPSFGRMRDHFRHTSGIQVSPKDFADFCLYREFFRRPKRMNSAETMGLIALDYPLLEGTNLPPGWPLGQADWDDFLKLVVDFFLRDVSAVDMNRDYLRWMGIPVRQRFVQGPEAEGDVAQRQRRWPAASTGGRPSRLVRLLREAAQIDESGSSVDRINEALRYAWHALRPKFRQAAAGYLLDLRAVAVLREPLSGYVCPYTRRALNATLSGFSPYLPANGKAERCVSFEPPRVPMAYWRNKAGRSADREEISDWLENDAKVRRVRELGVWSNLNDRIAANSHYFEAAEHSAQLAGSRLRKLEERFKAGELNVLSCSTTMEMGVDIGGLSAVVMNNAPPSSANYLQRAGRAGRRGEGVSFAVTLCPSSPHGEQVFANPLWPFTSTTSLPRVSLDSRRLVQRHINSLCLADFLDGMDVRRLKTGWFFEQDEHGTVPARRFVEWCRATRKSEQLSLGVDRLVRGTVLETTVHDGLFKACSDAMKVVADAWTGEVDALKADAEQILGNTQDSPSPAWRAIERQLRRLEGEYLLGELARRHFLPGYGFPTGVVNFVTTTVEDLKKEDSRQTREESFGKRAGYPSRALEMAIREYAPGAEVVIDGRVYQSSGVTLNWHLPPEAADISEVQAIGHVWRCRQCGATGDVRSKPERCPHCGTSPETRKYLEPAGFAVDLGYRPHNNIVSPAFVPVEPPWISCPTSDWTTIDDPVSGRFRYSDSGHLFHGSRGVTGHGYAVCLRCGRAASETRPASESVLPESVREGHLRLRGGKDLDGTGKCDGSGYAIQRELTLGGSRTTDVFELQLDGLTCDGTALSLGIALCRAFTRRLGIEEQEIGVTVRQGKAADETVQQSIFLYDSSDGGNGYVAALREHVRMALRETRGILHCVNHCDLACHACLLTYDTQYHSAKLDRHTCLSFLADGGLAGRVGTSRSAHPSSPRVDRDGTHIT